MTLRGSDLSSMRGFIAARGWPFVQSPFLVCLWFWGIFLFALCPALGALAKEPPAPGGSQHTFVLGYCEDMPDVVSMEPPHVEPVFKREPAYAGKQVIRGVLCLENSPQWFVGYACDVKARKLYIDENRNLDLLDDPPARVAVQEKGTPDWLWFRAKLQAPLPKSVPYVFQLVFDSNHLVGGMTVRSGWSGEVELAGRRWNVGVMKGVGSDFGARDLLLLTTTGTLETSQEVRASRVSLNADSALFIDGRLYRPRYALDTGTSQPSLSLTFAECPQKMPMGTLNLTGKGLERLVLKKAALTTISVILQNPSPGKVAVPVGAYYRSQILLNGGPGKAFFGSDYSVLIVLADKESTFRYGEPLTPQLSVTRRGTQLGLIYAALGTGNEIYTSLLQDEAHRPRFCIYQGDKQLVAGNFEYG